MKRELSLHSYWDSNTSEERVDIVERAFKMIEAQREYIALLSDELDETAVIAHIHGWRSSKTKEGEQVRNKIESLL